jgi:DNA-directed RNA polymerase specialized sigma24 family protein
VTSRRARLTQGALLTEAVVHGESFSRKLINQVALRAEEQMESGPGKKSWFTRFRAILRSERDLLKELRELAKVWPPLERAIFECCCLQGISLHDLALATGCTARVLHDHVRSIQFRLRQEIVRQVLTESKPGEKGAIK